MTLFVITFNN